MADDKKPPKKEESKGTTVFSDWDPVEIFVILIIISAIFGFLSKAIMNIFSGNISTGGLSFYGIPTSSFVSFFGFALPLLKILSFILSGLLLAGCVILAQLRNEVVAEEKAKLYPEGYEPSHASSGDPTILVESYERDPVKERWQRVLELVSSDSESNWRAAIIDADIILDELLDNLELPGDTIGEKLKAVEKSDFNTLDMAWQAHKVRNDIAHGGSNFLLNQRDARHTISLFETVFREFHMI